MDRVPHRLERLFDDWRVLQARADAIEVGSRARVAAANSVRQRKRRRSCPVWADREAITAVYGEARRVSRETGVLHEVDHVVPLVSAVVCGLHVAWNLRVVTAGVNRSKGNRF